MRHQSNHQLTIGFICTWPVYQGTTIDRYAHSLIQGISAAASEQDCNLLLGCGFSAAGNNPQNRSFWPVPGPDVNFVPVGPWNTDGLIIRQSCGCPSTGTNLSFSKPNSLEPALQLIDLTHAMTQASLIEARNSLLEDLEEQCSSFLDAFLDSLRLQDANLIMREIKKVLAWTDERDDEDAHIWQAGMAILYQKMSTLLNLVPTGTGHSPIYKIT